MEAQESPPWLSNSFLNSILQSLEGNEKKVEVVKWTCRDAVPPGINYLSRLYSVSVDYSIGKTSSVLSLALIVKVPLESGYIKEYVESVDGYRKEVRMYKEVLPRMYELLDYRLTPRAFDTPLDRILVLEDLREQGYKMGDRLKQLDAAHCRQFMLCLAKLHALSVALYERQPDLIKDVGTTPIFSPDAPGKDMQEMILKFDLSAVASIIDKLPSGCERYAEMIRERNDSFYDTMVNIYKPTDGLNVLTHGDTWTNNILYKYSESGEIVDVKLIDFQTCKLSSFAKDIILFWWTSANENVRENQREEMFQVYFEGLNENLEKLNCRERISKRDFDIELKKCAPAAIHVMCTMLRVVTADPDNLLDFTDFDLKDFTKPISDTAKGMKNYNSKYYKAILPNMLRQMEAFGAFT